mmetsp:Transcript_103184/g.296045  ORF Transcript_103184/g.296045 Transcript_103184/m.296045 type:complete len:423 (-) Transcript_103184:2808-4076(-)
MSVHALVSAAACMMSTQPSVEVISKSRAIEFKMLSKLNRGATTSAQTLSSSAPSPSMQPHRAFEVIRSFSSMVLGGQLALSHMRCVGSVMSEYVVRWSGVYIGGHVMNSFCSRESTPSPSSHMWNLPLKRLTPMIPKSKSTIIRMAKTLNVCGIDEMSALITSLSSGYLLIMRSGFRTRTVRTALSAFIFPPLAKSTTEMTTMTKSRMFHESRRYDLGPFIRKPPVIILATHSMMKMTVAIVSNNFRTAARPPSGSSSGFSIARQSELITITPTIVLSNHFRVTRSRHAARTGLVCEKMKSELLSSSSPSPPFSASAGFSLLSVGFSSLSAGASSASLSTWASLAPANALRKPVPELFEPVLFDLSAAIELIVARILDLKPVIAAAPSEAPLNSSLPSNSASRIPRKRFITTKPPMNISSMK